MTGYFVTLVIGAVLAVASRIAFRVDLRRSVRRHAEPHIALLAPALFVLTISGALVVVGLLGVVHEARAGQRPPVPLDVIYPVLLAGLAGLIVSRRIRTARRRRVLRERRRVRLAAAAEDGRR